MATTAAALRHGETIGGATVILVFGKTGQVARELQRFSGVIALSREDVDLSVPEDCASIIHEYSPKAVINAAAYTDVEGAENEELRAIYINGEAPTAMAMACSKMDIPLLHLSTDYVFDGTGDRPWSPEDPINPKNAYGRSKLAGEMGVRAIGGVHVILRTSWVVSANGSNFIKTILRLSEARDELKVVCDQIGGPTPARDIATACVNIVAQLTEHPEKSGTYHYSGMPDVSWAEFASVICAESGNDVKITPVLTTEFPSAASRPLNSRLDTSDLTSVFGITRPDWRVGLKEILKELEIKQ